MGTHQTRQTTLTPRTISRLHHRSLVLPNPSNHWNYQSPILTRIPIPLMGTVQFTKVAMHRK